MIISPAIIGSICGAAKWRSQQSQGGGGCNTITDKQEGIDDTGLNIALNPGGSYNYVATRFYANENYIPCKLSIYAYKTGTPTTISASIYSDNAGSVNSIIGGWSNAISINSMPTVTADWFEIPNLNVGQTLNIGSWYWIVIHASWEGTWSDWITWRGVAGVGNGWDSQNSSDGSTFTSFSGNVQGKFRLYK